MSARIVAVVVGLLIGCAGVKIIDPLTDAGIGLVDGGSNTSSDAGGCLAPETLESSTIEAGRIFLVEGGVGGDFIPRLAWDNLYLVWGTGRPADVAAAARARYGFAKALTANDGLPMGLTAAGSWVRADCRVCHAGEVAGETLMGAPNTQVDLELLVDDLKALAALSGMPVTPRVALRTGARGISDIIGMTIQLGELEKPSPLPLHREIGFQDPPAWWSLAAKTRVYTDGSAPQRGHRTFMATQLAFGTSQSALEALEPSYVKLRAYMLSLRPPAWPFEAPAGDEVERGRALFGAQCASCHGAASCERSESVEVARADIGTDPARNEQFGDNEIAVINGSWFGARDPLRRTGGYIAPPLRGVWASAPYFHNGSVPTLEGVLDSTKRPKRFRLLGTARASYDPVAVGLKVQTYESAPVNPPRAERAALYDTTRSGLGNGGHLFGDALTAAQRHDLLSFLKTR